MKKDLLKIINEVLKEKEITPTTQPRRVYKTTSKLMGVSMVY
jgi:hypothetical protein